MGIIGYWRENFPKEFQALGFVEGRNLQLLWFEIDEPTSGPNGTIDLAALRANARKTAMEMARSDLDCAVCYGEPGARFLQEASRTLPIVTDVNDPVGMGFARSLAKPGGNITGLHNGDDDSTLKSVELAKKLIPGLRCMAWIGTETLERHAKLTERAARALNLKSRRIIIKGADPASISEARRDIASLRREGCLVAAVATPGNEIGEVVLAAAKESRIALTGADIEQDGVLFEFDAMRLPEHRSVKRIPAIVSRILNGERPGDIPFEGPSSFELRLNLRTAAKLGIAVPADVLVMATSVVR